MSSPALHIKDAYFFEVPKFLWPSHRKSKTEFPEVWVRLDPEFQAWEASRLYGQLEAKKAEGLPGRDELLTAWTKWQQDPANFGKPLAGMLEEQYAAAQAKFAAWKSADKTRQDAPLEEYLTQANAPQNWFCRAMADSSFQEQWRTMKSEAGVLEAYFKEKPAEWPVEKLASYNKHLSGKLLIPQPFGGRLRNLHEAESGFCLSKFMVIEVVVALVLLALFAWVGRKASGGAAPKGRLWNLLEVFLVYVRDNIARPAIGAHDGDKFVPLLWTIFMFVLACNLCGMLPWVGAPTSSFGVTTGLALVTFGTGLLCGMKKFGPLGFFANQVPHMHLPFPLGYVIKPMLLVIELLGLCIKHGVLAVRLLANMVAGHLVLLGVMGLAFGATAAAAFLGAPNWQWYVTAGISIGGATLFSCLELLVAFLQAYIFTFLSALFIGAAIHHH